VDRRGFIAGCFGLLSARLAAEAQPTGTVRRVALVFSTSSVSSMAGAEPIHPTARAFIQGLRALGYVEGQNGTCPMRMRHRGHEFSGGAPPCRSGVVQVDIEFRGLLD
jgi:hypothetical protein